MSKAIHISQARGMLDEGKPAELRVVRLRDGKVATYKDAISLRYDYYKGTRTIKLPASHQIRTIHDVCIIGIDDLEVFL